MMHAAGGCQPKILIFGLPRTHAELRQSFVALQFEVLMTAQKTYR
jgi:hypothetical protein